MTRRLLLLLVAAVLLVLLVGGPLARSGAPVVSCHYREGGVLPDPRPQCTPGVLNHAVTQATIGKTICKRGWASSVRPPTSVTGPLKLKLMRRYGWPRGTSPRDLELDHLTALELGGAPADPRNLFPELHHILVGGRDLGSYAKDKVENQLHAKVCAGTMKLWVARRIMRTDWTKGLAP